MKEVNSRDTTNSREMKRPNIIYNINPIHEPLNK
jgi:hypothetical protein